MGKRSKMVYSPTLIVEEKEDMLHPKKLRKLDQMEDAALALLLFRKNGCDSETNIKYRRLGRKKTSWLRVIMRETLRRSNSAESTVTVEKQLSTANHIESQRCEAPRKTLECELRMAVPGTQRAVLPPGRPLPMAPKLAGHLIVKTRPINLKLD